MNTHTVKLSFWNNPIINYLRKTRIWNSRFANTVRKVDDFVYTIRKKRLPYRIKLIFLERLLCGGENGLTAAQYAHHTGNLLRPSMHFSKGPHVQFLKQYLTRGDEILNSEVFKHTAYYKNAIECLYTIGHYFECTREDQIVQIAQRFICQFKNGTQQAHSDTDSIYFSPPGSPVRVRPIKYSNFFEVIDGNHRLAIGVVRGEKTYPMLVVPEPAITPIQQLLLEQTWLRGRKELYQPIDCHELRDQWILVRRCSDRFKLIKAFLAEHNLIPNQCKTYLDIAASYGWFVKEFRGLGFQACGVDIDWAAVEVGRLAYGLSQDQITRSEVVRFLKNNTQRYDITSSFSLLHHFFLGRASISAEEMLGLIDSKTGTVFFLDMGQSHEAWFRQTLPNLDPDYIEDWLQTNSSFRRIYRLGKDQDNKPPFEDNYGRTLFACMR